MKVFLLALLVAAVAAAPKPFVDTDEEIIPSPVILPESVLPEIVPSPVLLPAPVLPAIVPAPVILPAPVLPEIVPAPVILPAPVLPEIVPAPVILPEPELPVIPEPETPVVVEPLPQPEPEAQPPTVVAPEIPNGDIYNDGIVQVTVNAPETGYFGTLQSWFSMMFNYISNGVTTSHQIV